MLWKLWDIDTDDDIALLTAIEDQQRASRSGGSPMGVIRLYAAEGGGSISNSAAEVNIFPFAPAGGTDVGSRVIAGAMATQNACLWFRVWGRINTTGTPTLTIRVKVGATVTFTIGPNALTSGASTQWWLDVPLFVRAPGNPGAVSINNGRFYYQANGTVQQLAISNAAAINWGSNPTLQISFQFGTADPANTLNFDAAILELV